MADKEVLVFKDFVLRESDLDILNGPCYLNDQIIGFYFSYLSSLYESTDILFVPPSVSFWLANAEDSESLQEFVEPLKFPSKNLIFFAVNDCVDLEGGDGGSHWSLLVYHRSLNEFLHHDSMEGMNESNALKLYEIIKDFVCPASLQLPKLASKGKQNKKQKNRCKKPAASTNPAPAIVDPSFKECTTPQQMNGYDCGLYVMAIARTICEWYCSKSQVKVDYWFLKKHVDSSVEQSMRTEVLNLIKDLRDRC